MSNEAFTPGPWVAGELSDTGGYDCMTAGIKTGPATLDAADYGQTRCNDLPHYIEEKMLADAHLIAAAPEMYESLLPFADMFDLIQSETEGMSDEDDFDLLLHDHLFAQLKVADFRKAHSALSKARGEAQ